MNSATQAAVAVAAHRESSAGNTAAAGDIAEGARRKPAPGVARTVGGPPARGSTRSGARALRGVFRGIGGAVGLAFVLEFTTVIAVGIALLSVGPVGGDVSMTGYVLASLFCAGSLVMLLDYQRLYGPAALIHPWRSIGRILAAVFVSFGALALTGCAASGHLSYDRAWLFAFAGGAALSLCVGRFLFARVLEGPSTSGLFTRNVIIIGAGSCGLQLLQDIESSRQPWMRVLAIFDDRVRHGSERVPRKINGVRVLGDVRRALTFARRVRVDDIVVALPWSAHERIGALVRSAESISANIHLAGDTIGLVSQDPRLSALDGLPALRMSRKPLAGWSYVVKRTADVIGASIGLALLAPLMMLIAVGVKLQSRGPVFFRQPRFGINNRTIHVLKFRSMYHEAQDLSADRLVTRHDPRVTPFGRFLRRSSLDELPQLINVLLGGMSLVGPRPHAKNAKAAGRMYQDVVLEYAHRHRIKPGITGWAQINGWRGETDTDEKIIRRCEHDLYYINNASFFLDVYIICATVLRVPFQRNAY